MYAGKVTILQSSPDVRAVIFEDGTHPACGRSGYRLKASVNGGIDSQQPETLRLVSSGTMELQAAGSIAIRSGGNVTITGTDLTLGQ